MARVSGPINRNTGREGKKAMYTGVIVDLVIFVLLMTTGTILEKIFDKQMENEKRKEGQKSV